MNELPVHLQFTALVGPLIAAGGDGDALDRAMTDLMDAGLVYAGVYTWGYLAGVYLPHSDAVLVHIAEEEDDPAASARARVLTVNLIQAAQLRDYDRFTATVEILQTDQSPVLVKLVAVSLLTCAMEWSGRMSFGESWAWHMLGVHLVDRHVFGVAPEAVKILMHMSRDDTKSAYPLMTDMEPIAAQAVTSVLVEIAAVTISRRDIEVIEVREADGSVCGVFDIHRIDLSQDYDLPEAPGPQDWAALNTRGMARFWRMVLWRKDHPDRLAHPYPEGDLGAFVSGMEILSTFRAGSLGVGHLVAALQRQHAPE